MPNKSSLLVTPAFHLYFYTITPADPMVTSSDVFEFGLKNMTTPTTPSELEGHPSFPSAAWRKRGAPANATSAASSSLACKKCRARKVKCDAALPACSGCVKAGVPCIVADYTTSRDYTRSEVNDLEERLYLLEASLGQPDAVPSGPMRRPRRRPAPSLAQYGEAINNGPSPARYVGREAGVDFFQPMLEAIRKQSPVSLNHSGVSASQLQASSIVYHEPHTLPTREEGLRFASSYLKEFHVAHQFLDAVDIASLFTRVWNPEVGVSPSKRRDGRQQDLFTANMIMAIGAVGMFRAGAATLHPFGFFTAALSASPPSEMSFGTIQDVENLLLIAYFGIFYNIGCSIWELSRLCTRICVELRLYKADAEENLTDGELNRRRRVFWEVYSLDRFASMTLGRPFAIDDAVITTGKAQPPEEQFDIDTLHANQAFIQAGWPSHVEANDRRVSNHLLSLSSITSSLHRSQQTSGSRARESDTPSIPRMSNNSTHSSYRLLFKLRDDLEHWHNTSPRFENPSCLYQCPEYFDLCFQKEKLYLIRVAIDRNPVRGALPPQYLLTPCLDTAHSVIRHFDSLRRQNLATCTRSNTHLVFTTSLIILFLSFAQVHPQYRKSDADLKGTSRVDVGSWWAGLLEEGKAPTQEESLEVLAMASATMEWLAENMPDMIPYAQFLDALRQELSKEIYRSSAGGNGLNAECAQSYTQPLATEHLSQPNHSSNSIVERTADQVYPNIALGDSMAHQLQGHESFSLASHGQGISPEGFLFDLFPVEDFTQDGTGMQPMMASWPFSQMPWMESFNTELSGYDADLFQFP